MCSLGHRRREELFLLTPLREGRLFAILLSAESTVFLLTPLREGRPPRLKSSPFLILHFYSRPCGRGDARVMVALADESISTHAPAGGATGGRGLLHQDGNHFYSRPCGRGDYHAVDTALFGNLISTHAPAGGATVANNYTGSLPYLFLLTPLREGRRITRNALNVKRPYFYSRPCGRGDEPYQARDDAQA